MDELQKERIELGEMIKTKMSNCRLRQIDLAKFLNITPAAISQMLNGKLTPNLSQLNKLAEKMKCSREEYSEWQQLVAAVKSGGHLKLSNLNYELREARRKLNISISELSRQTDISPINIKLFETNPFHLPNKEELNRLNKTLHLDLNSWTSRAANYEEQEVSLERKSAEQPGKYHAGNMMIPCLELQMLKKFQRSLGTVSNFARTNAQKTYFCRKEYESMWALAANEEDLPLFKGLNALMIIDGDEYQNNADVVLTRHNGKFSLKRYFRQTGQVILEPLLPGEEREVWDLEDADFPDFFLPVISILFEIKTKFN